MSMKADIDDEFEELINKLPAEYKKAILACKLGVYESLDWDTATEEVELEIKEIPIFKGTLEQLERL